MRRLPALDAPIAAAAGAVAAFFLGQSAVSGAGAPVLGTAQADKFGAIYLHDALHRALAAGRFPLVDAEQLWPVGAPLAAMNGDNVLEMFVSGLLRLGAPWPLWFNLAHLVWVPLLAVAFLPLGRRLWPGHDVAAVVLRVAAGLTWALSPVFLGEIVAGRLTQVVLVGLPLALAQLHAATEADLDRRGRVLGAVGVALVGLGYWFYAVFLGLLAPVFLVAGVWAGRGRATLRELLWIGGGAAVLVSPALLGIAYSSLSLGVSPEVPAPPGGLSPVFDNALQLARAQPAQLQGWFPWALAPGLVLGFGLAARGLRRRGGAGAPAGASGGGPAPGAAVPALRWFALAALALLFALGPGQVFGGRVWLLPYWPLWKLVPSLGRLTHPSRWADFGMIFLVVASFGGLAWSRSGRWLAPLVPAALLAQLFLQGAAPLPTYSPPAAPLYEAAAATPGALIVLPVMHAPDTIRFTPIHRRPVIGGMAEGLPWAWPPAFRSGFEGNPLLLQLLALGDGKLATLDLRQGDVDDLRAAGFTQVLYDAGAWQQWRHRADPGALTALTAAFGAPRFQNADGALWDLPTSAPPGHAAPPAGVRLPAP